MLVDPRGIGDVDEPCEVDSELGDLLKSLGFDPGVPIFRGTPDAPFNTVFDQIVTGLCGEERWRSPMEPINLAWRTRDRRHGCSVIKVLVELLRAVHKPSRFAADGPVTTEAGVVFYDPDWYLRGSCIRNWNRPLVGRFHAYIQMEPDALSPPDWPHGMIVQLVKEPTGADPGTPLMWGVGWTRPVQW
jgi:hypothetical protein